MILHHSGPILTDSVWALFLIGQAAPLPLEAVEGRIQKLGPQHPHTQESIKNLIELYEACDKPEKAAQWRAKLPPDQATQER